MAAMGTDGRGSAMIRLLTSPTFLSLFATLLFCAAVAFYVGRYW